MMAGERIITANRLTDGVVVYRAAPSVWDRDFQKAAIFTDDAALEKALADAAAHDEGLVAGPYAIAVENGEPSGTKARRENIRLHGPTTGNSKRARSAGEKSHVPL